MEKPPKRPVQVVRHKRASLGQTVALTGLGLLGGGEIVRRGMERASDGIVAPINKGLEMLPHTASEREISEHRRVMEATEAQPSSDVGQQGVPAEQTWSEANPRIVLPPESQEDRVELDWRNGEALVRTIWNDPVFLRLRTPEEIGAYLSNFLQSLCDGTDGTCEPTTVLLSIQQELANRLRQERSTELMTQQRQIQIARGIRFAAHGRHDGETYGELDIALASRNPQLVEEAFRAPLDPSPHSPSDEFPASGEVYKNLGLYLNIDRIRELIEIYPTLSTDVREAIRESILQRRNEVHFILSRAEEEPARYVRGPAAQQLASAQREAPILDEYIQRLHL